MSWLPHFLLLRILYQLQQARHSPRIHPLSLFISPHVGSKLLLRQLQSHSLGISVNNTYARGHRHTNNIHTLANSQSAVQSQIEMVSRFTSENFLTLNELKCEVIICKKSSRLPSPVSITNGDTSECSFPVKEEAKCMPWICMEIKPVFHWYD